MSTDPVRSAFAKWVETYSEVAADCHINPGYGTMLAKKLHSQGVITLGLWISRSNPGKQYLLAVACALVGLVMLVSFRDFRAAGTNAMAGFFLGALLAGIGVAGFLTTGKQSVVVDPKTRRITVEDSSLFSTKKRSILFSDIAGISIGFLGKRSNHVTWYYLVLKLSDGENYSLFAPGRFFEGGSDRSMVMGWQQRLQNYIDQK